MTDPAERIAPVMFLDRSHLLWHAGKGGISPPFFCAFALRGAGVSRVLHVIEDPVPHDKEAGDDHVGEQSCAEECSGEDNLGVDHDPHLPKRRDTVGPGLDPAADRVVSE